METNSLLNNYTDLRSRNLGLVVPASHCPQHEWWSYARHIFRPETQCVGAYVGT